MANVNKINLDNNEYHIMDIQARLDATAAARIATEALEKINAIEGGAGGGTTTPPTTPPAVGIYGARWHQTLSPTKLDRRHDALGMTFAPSVGNVAGHSDFDNVYPWSDIKLCNMVDGMVTYYEGEAGFSREPVFGDVMVEIPKFYYRISNSFAFRDFEISSLRPSEGPTPDGFLVSPRHAPIPGKPTGWDKIYVSAHTLNNEYRAVSGNASIAGITRAAARSGCKGRGSQYNLWDYATYATIHLLYLVETADWDSQAAVGPGFTENNTGQINTGGANSVAGHSGRANGDANAAKNAVKYRHMENLWGNLLQWCDGMNFNGDRIFLSLNPAAYDDNTEVGYVELSYQKAATSGWQKTLGFDPAFPFAQICTDATGADGNFIPDYYHQNTGWRVLSVGGAWPVTSHAGLFYFYTFNPATHTHASLGCRLLVLP